MRTKSGPCLDKPPNNDNRHGCPFLLVPNTSRGLRTLLCCHAGIPAPSGFHDLLLGRGCDLLLAVVRCIYPPHYSKEYHPCRRYNVVCEEYVCEIERFLGVLLRHQSRQPRHGPRSATCLSYGSETPAEGNKGQDRVYIHTELRSGPSRSCQHSDEAVHACDFVEELGQKALMVKVNDEVRGVGVRQRGRQW